MHFISKTYTVVDEYLGKSHNMQSWTKNTISTRRKQTQQQRAATKNPDGEDNNMGVHRHTHTHIHRQGEKKRPQ